MDTSGSTPAVTQVDSITTTPIAKAVDGDLTAHLGTIGGGSSLNEEIFEVDGAPANGQVQGTYIIFNSSGTVLVGPSIGFNFTDGKAHVSEVGRWNSNYFSQLVEVWNQSTGLADLQLSLINPTNGNITTGWTAPTELQSITKLSSVFVSGVGAGMILAADGSNAAGVNGAFLYDLNDTAGGAGGTISETVVIPYSGTVLADAKITPSGISNEFVVFWVDSNGMTIDLINANLQVLETYNIAAANIAGEVTVLGAGQLLVTYGTGSGRNGAVDDALIISTTPANPPPPTIMTDMVMVNSNNGDYEIYDIGKNTIVTMHALGQVGSERQVAGFGRFFGTDTTDMLLRNRSTAQFEVFDISNNTITNSAAMGQVGLEWAVAGFGDFSGNPGETDMLMHNSHTGQVEVYDISNNAITSSSPAGQVGLEWAVAGFGDFSTRANETDMLLRNSNTGQLEIFDISNNQLVSAASIGQVGSEWQFLGFGDFSGNANEADMLARDVNNGVLEIYDIRNNAITGAASIGQVGTEWSVAGFGDFSGNANETDMLMRNSNTGVFEVYDIVNNQITNVGAMGQVGNEWSVAGIAGSPSGGSAPANAQFVQAMASYAPAGSTVVSLPAPDQAATQSMAPSILTAANSQSPLAG